MSSCKMPRGSARIGQLWKPSASFRTTILSRQALPRIFEAWSAIIRKLFWANDLSTPIIPSQDRGFREGYFKATVSIDKGIHK